MGKSKKYFRKQKIIFFYFFLRKLFFTFGAWIRNGSGSGKPKKTMKKLLIIAIAMLFLASCSYKTCSAYNNYPQKPKRTLR